MWRNNSYTVLISLIVMWYLFSYLFNARLKTWFRVHTTATSLTMSADPGEEAVLPTNAVFPLLFSIFMSNTAATVLWLVYTDSWRSLCALASLCLLQLTRSHLLDFLLLCSSGIVGVVATVLVLQYGSIQLVQIARSTGPLFTACWAYLSLDQATTGPRLACLAATLAGTMLASWQEPSFCMATAALMFTVNATLTYRNVATKKLLAHFPHCNISSLAAILLALTSAAGLVVVGLLWGGSLMLHQSALMPLDLAAQQQLLVLGVCNFAYNLASQLVLASVAVVSHGMLELFKRIFVLAAASLLLKDVEWQWHNVLGAALASVATAAYFFYSSHSHSHAHSHGHCKIAEAQLASRDSGHSDLDQSVEANATELRYLGLHHNPSLASATASDGWELSWQDKDSWPGDGNAGELKASAQSKQRAVARSTWPTGLRPNGGPVGIYSARAGCLGSPAARARLAHCLISALLLASPVVLGGEASLRAVLPSSLITQLLPTPPPAVQHSRPIADALHPQHAAAAPGLLTTTPTALPPPASLLQPSRSDLVYVAGVQGSATSWSPFLEQAALHRTSTNLSACAADAASRDRVTGAPAPSPSLGALGTQTDPLVPGTAGPQGQAAGGLPGVAAGGAAGSTRQAGQHMLAPAAVNLDSTAALEAAAELAAAVVATRVVQEPVQAGVAGQQGGARLGSAAGQLHVSGEGAGSSSTGGSTGGSTSSSTGSSGTGGVSTFTSLSTGSTVAVNSSQRPTMNSSLAAGQATRAVNSSHAAAIAAVTYRTTLQVLVSPPKPTAPAVPATGQQPAAAAIAAAAALPPSQIDQPALRSASIHDANNVAVAGSDGGGPGARAIGNANALSGGVATVRPAHPDALVGVYTGWIGRDNLGDEIVADIFFDLLVAAVLGASDKDTRVTLDRNATSLSTQHPGCDSSAGVACDFAVLGGGSTVYVDYVKRIADIIVTGAPLLIFGAGRQSGLIPKSINDKYIALLGKANSVGGVRGRLTADYIARLATKRLPVVRDSALLAGLLYPKGRALLPCLPSPLRPNESGLSHATLTTLLNSPTLASLLPSPPDARPHTAGPGGGSAAVVNAWNMSAAQPPSPRTFALPSVEGGPGAGAGAGAGAAAAQDTPVLPIIQRLLKQSGLSRLHAPSASTPTAQSSSACAAYSSATGAVRPLAVLTLKGPGKARDRRPGAPLGPAPEELLAGRASGLLAAYLHLIRHLVNDWGFQVVLQAVDAESQALHAAYLDVFNAGVTAPEAPPVRLHSEYRDWAAVVDLYSRASLSINSRLHSGVMAAAALRPLVYVAGNSKYFDLMATLDLQPFILNPDRQQRLPAVVLAQRMAASALEALRNSSSISSSLAELQRTTLQLYQASMADLLQRLKARGPQRFKSVMCCRHIHVSRSPPVAYRSIISIHCLQPRTAPSSPAYPAPRTEAKTES